jgi:hypothetical protein
VWSPENHLDQIHVALFTPGTDTRYGVFELFKMSPRKEKQSKGMKGEAQKAYLALLVFYNNTIISVVRWSFERTGFCLHSYNLMKPLTVDPASVSQRLDVPELSFEVASFYREQLDP